VRRSPSQQRLVEVDRELRADDSAEHRGTSSRHTPVRSIAPWRMNVATATTFWNVTPTRFVPFATFAASRAGSAWAP
jgi:hypothetical protein